jgi:phospholipase C
LAVQVIVPPDNENPNNKVYPCFDYQTMGDFQQAFSWKYYTPNTTSIWTAPSSIQHICQSSGYGGQCVGSQFTDNVDLKPAHVLTDISGCNLRDVSWVIPTDANSDHAYDSDGGGPSWVASIVNAIGTATGCDGGAGYWSDTAIIVTWDDWGGWYDHEPPPRRRYPYSDYEFGFRVPLLVVSAYTPAGYIDNQKYDFGSILRFVQQNFGVTEGALGFADARSQNDLTSFFMGSNSPRTFKVIKSPKDANFFINDKRPQGDPDND